MMKIYLKIISLLCLLITGNAFAQCPMGDIVLSTQEQIDNFASDYPGCTELSGNLKINVASFNIIDNLSGLAVITNIVGDLQIHNNRDLTTLTGLENISSIGGALSISNNDILTTLAGLENINSVGNSLHITHNPNLINLEGLANLSSVGGRLMISGNANLASIGLVNFSLLGADLWIFRNPNLTSLAGLENLNTIPRDLHIDDNDNLTSFTGLNNLESVGNLLKIEDCDGLVELPGFESLNSVGDSLRIENNNNLTSLIGLESLSNIGTHLEIAQNDNLTSLAGLENLNHLKTSCTIISNDSLTSLNGLDNFSTLYQLNILYNNNLVSLSGLDNMSYLGQLNIFSNDNLTSLSGLGNIDYLSILHVNSNNSFTSFTGIENLDTLADINIINNENLASLNGFENINEIEGRLHISNNNNLTSLSGLENLTTIGTDLKINSNNNLTSPMGLENLNQIGGQVHISSNSNLTSLTGLENLNQIGGSLIISDNDNLTSLIGLENLDSLGGPLGVLSNLKLSDCAVESICHLLHKQNGYGYIIVDNAEGCNSIGEVIYHCASVWEYAVEGNIFMEANNNCFQDTSELGLSRWIVKIENEQSTHYGYTYDDGKYATPVDTGTYIVTPIPPNSLWENTCFESDTVTLTTSITRDTVDIGASTSTFCPLLEIDITAPFVRRCFDSNYYVRYCNSGTAVAENAYVEAQLDPFFTYQNSTITGIDLGNNLYSFDLGNINIGECGSFRIDVYVDCDSTEIGQTHCMEAHIFPDSICTSALPLWDGASIEVDAQCLGDSIEFKIENVGTGDMSDSLEYIVIIEDLIYQRTNFKLNSGNNLTFYKQASGVFHRLEAEQSPGHPGNSMPSVFIEGCGENNNGEISMGFVNYYLLDEGNVFMSIDCQENIGSYDPNDKQAFPVGHGPLHFITDSTDLEYLIRFQNTGTDTAFNITIRDTISPHLDIETLRPGVASHPYTYDIDSSNIAVFSFDNIMLPDSNVNEAASHGFIKFNIEQQPDNELREVIENKAAIYFDFNEPIITNTVFHTVNTDFLSLITSVVTPPDVTEAGISVNVFPNPFDEYTTFKISGKVNHQLQLSLYDIMGREVLRQQNSKQPYINLYRNSLPSGVYVFKLIDKKQSLATGKLIIK